MYSVIVIMVSWVCEIIPTVHAKKKVNKTRSLLLSLSVKVNSVLIWVWDAAIDGDIFPNLHKQGFKPAITIYTQQHL